MTRFIRHNLLSLQFFTRIPVTGRLAQWVGYSPAMLRDSAGHFSGIGVLVGALVAAFTALQIAGLPAGGYAPLVAAVWGTALGVLLTGAFHEDGLADVFDGLGGSPHRDRALVIMKDSRVGAFEAIALMLVLVAKVSLLALLGSVTGALLCFALFLAYAVSRTWPLLLIRLMPRVGDPGNGADSKSKPLADQISGGSLITALIWCLMALVLVAYAQEETAWIAIGLSDIALLQALAFSTFAWGVMGRWFWRRLGGFTGDCLGAPQQLCELAFYLGLALSL